MLQNMLLLLNAVVAIALVIAIMLQRSDSSIGGAFGGGSTGEVPSSANNPIAKATVWLAAIFMGSSLFLAYVSSGAGKSQSVVDVVEENTLPLPNTVNTELPLPSAIETTKVPDEPSTATE